MVIVQRLSLLTTVVWMRICNMATLPSTSLKDQFSGYYAIVAWALFGLLVLFAIRSRIGYTIAYFFVLASILIVLAIGSPTIAKIFNYGQIAATQSEAQ